MKAPPTGLSEPSAFRTPTRPGTHFVTGDNFSPSAPAAASLDVFSSPSPPLVPEAELQIAALSTEDFVDASVETFAGPVAEALFSSPSASLVAEAPVTSFAKDTSTEQPVALEPSSEVQPPELTTPSRLLKLTTPSRLLKLTTPAVQPARPSTDVPRILRPKLYQDHLQKPKIHLKPSPEARRYVRKLSSEARDNDPKIPIKAEAAFRSSSLAALKRPRAQSADEDHKCAIEDHQYADEDHRCANEDLEYADEDHQHADEYHRFAGKVYSSDRFADEVHVQQPAMGTNSDRRDDEDRRTALQTTSGRPSDARKQLPARAPDVRSKSSRRAPARRPKSKLPQVQPPGTSDDETDREYGDAAKLDKHH